MSTFDEIMADQFVNPAVFDMPATAAEVAEATAMFDITSAVMAELKANCVYDDPADRNGIRPFSHMHLHISPRNLAIMLRRVARRLGHDL